MAQKQITRTNAPGNADVLPTRREFIGTAVKGAAALALGLGGEAGCMAPRTNVFQPPRTGRDGTAALTPDTINAFEHAIRRSPVYRVELSGDGGAFGHWSYARVKNVESVGLSYYEISPEIRSEAGDRWHRPVFRTGPGQPQVFNIPVEPTSMVGSDVLVAVGPDLASFSHYHSVAGGYRTVEVRIPPVPLGPSPAIEPLYSERDGSIVVLLLSQDKARAVRIDFDLMIGMASTTAYQ